MTMVMNLIKNGEKIGWTTPGVAIYEIAEKCLVKVSEKYDGAVIKYEFDWEKLKKDALKTIMRELKNEKFDSGTVSQLLYALDYIKRYMNEEGIDYIEFEW